jgi:hypothetical protein
LYLFICTVRALDFPVMTLRGMEDLD